MRILLSLRMQEVPRVVSRCCFARTDSLLHDRTASSADAAFSFGSSLIEEQQLLPEEPPPPKPSARRARDARDARDARGGRRRDADAGGRPSAPLCKQPRPPPAAARPAEGRSKVARVEPHSCLD